MKSVKNLLVPFIIMIMLVIGVIVYYAVERFRNKEPSETSSSGAVDVVYYNSTDVSSLSVFSRDTGNTTSVICRNDGNNGMIYEYSGDDADQGTVYSQYKLYDFVGNLTSFQSNSLISKKGNYADFGLDRPCFTITINTVNGTETKVYLGNKSPDGKYCYMFVEGAPDIYLVSSEKLDVASKTAVSFIDTIVLNLEYSDLKSVHFDRKTDGLSLDADVSVSDEGDVVFDIVKPYKHPASSYFTGMISRIISLNITDYVETDGFDPAKYGLDDPAYHFILNLNDGGKKELFFSKLINGVYYGYISGNDNYFMLNEYQLENLDMQETILIDPYVFSYQVTDISSITGTYNGTTFKFVLDVPEGKTLMSKESKVELDGRNAQITDLSGRAYCSVLYESISCINIGGIDTEAVTAAGQSPVLTLTFIGKKYNTIEYSFYRRDDDSFYVFKDGEYLNFYVYSREIFNDGGQDTYNYGYWKAYELLNDAISGNNGGVYVIPDE